MESITALLYDAVISGLNYHETEVEDRVYRQVDRWAEKGGRKKKQFQNDLMALLTQYQEQSFALGLKCGLLLAEEQLFRYTLWGAYKSGIMEADQKKDGMIIC